MTLAEHAQQTVNKLRPKIKSQNGDSDSSLHTESVRSEHDSSQMQSIQFQNSSVKTSVGGMCDSDMQGLTEAEKQKLQFALKVLQEEEERKKAREKAGSKYTDQALNQGKFTMNTFHLRYIQKDNTKVGSGAEAKEKKEEEKR